MSSITSYVGNRSGMSDAITTKTAWVSPTYVDDPYTHRFSTIQGAIDWAYSEYGVGSYSNQIVIMVMPGYYTEQIHSYTDYSIVAAIPNGDAIKGRMSVQLYNTGADAATYPLRSEVGDTYNMYGISIKTEIDTIIGNLPNGKFVNCEFRKGHFTEKIESKSVTFENCRFLDNTYGGFNMTGTDVAFDGWVGLTDCHISGAPTFSSTHSVESSKLNFIGTYVVGHLEIGGDWDFYTAKEGCISLGEAVRHSFDTTGEVKIYGGSCVNGIHFTSAPSVLEISRLSFSSLEDNQIPVGEADITADVDVTADVYMANIPQNGISGKIKTPDPKKHVGHHVTDSYLSLQDAIDSITVAGIGIIELHEDLINLAELTITGAKTITIEGSKAWSLSFTNDVIELGLNQIVTFSKIKDITGGVVEINGNGAEFHLYGCNHASVFSILLTSGVGALACINSTYYVAPTGLSALQVNSVDPDILITYSRLTGSTGQPAVEFTVEADDKFKAKYSTFTHGDGGANAPMSSTAADSNIAMYNCGLNAAWTPTHFTNTIAGANLTTDAAIDF